VLAEHGDADRHAYLYRGVGEKHGGAGHGPAQPLGDAGGLDRSGPGQHGSELLTTEAAQLAIGPEATGERGDGRQ
jgi:hypothetical protein